VVWFFGDGAWEKLRLVMVGSDEERVLARSASITFDAVPSVELPADRTAPSKARHFVIDTLQGWEAPSSVVDDSALLVSELVTNAILHAHSAPVVEVMRSDDTLRCVVRDASVALPRKRNYSIEAVTGRGLALVDALATRWGTDVIDDGKCVWFEVSLRPGADGNRRH
jgi:anti-sigma regulatory factor (Ser/Thr protein kinase)